MSELQISKKILAYVVLVIFLLPFLVFAQGDAQKKKVYYFYGDQCPHCIKVDEYFRANGIYEKYDITKLEFSNPFNTRLLLKFGEVFNEPSKGSVPAIAFGDKFIVGDQPIFDNFIKEIDAAGNAYELPNPDNIAQKQTAENQKNENNPNVPAPEGNKNNYFPVVIIVLIVAGVGTLIYVNRKKS